MREQELRHHSNIGRLCQYNWAAQHLAAGRSTFGTVIGVVGAADHWEYRLHLAVSGDIFYINVEIFKDYYEFI